ncbi:MAG: phosphoglycerate kinase [Armatimonadetes bacterium]|nr:phosphoglycerate kinase [Armatimonadota bacterium]
MQKKSIRDIEWAGKRALVRVDFNVPMEDGAVSNDRRIREAVPTIWHLCEGGASVVLMSHLGRPKGRDESLSLAPVAKRLSEILGKPVHFVRECIGEEAEQASSSLKAGEILLLENLRFHPEEEANDPGFAAALAKHGDRYVNDAFGTAHRAHASTEGVARLLPGVAGFLIEKELHYLGGALSQPERPFVALLGGAKVKDKIAVIENLLPKVDRLLIGGGMMFTFLKAKGYGIGRSLLDEERLDFARSLVDDPKILLPVDCVVASEISDEAAASVVLADAIPHDQIGLDIGPKSVEAFANEIKGAGTVVWNGPVGVFEKKPFQAGTLGVLQAMAECKGTTILGGGDTAAAAEQFEFEDQMSHISTGGGASLEFMEGRELPGIAALKDK